MIEENLKLYKDIKHFTAEIKRCFSKEEIEEIARVTGFVKRKGYIKSNSQYVAENILKGEFTADKLNQK
ncbi:hypothetical protein G9F73_019560 [Clostridium estertheticum]|uniref:hypothetical protein n=1 Tax=Clostridium estertheticum TaxID=238834 RepID=UPI0013EEE649|nr:hypothetical protein [Clostridium estertheticum]MBZ9609926.1 hypothetical protein [Clostridium estertheticum]